MTHVLNRRGASTLLAFWLLAYVMPLGWRPLVQPDELRYAEIAREMLASGDWVVPRLSGLRYFEDPPLAHWMNATSLAVFGENAFAVRFASCLCIGLIAAALWRFTRHYAGSFGQSDNAGIIAGIIFLSSPGALTLGNYAVPDGILMLWLTLALMTYYHALHACGPREALRRHALFGVFCGLAFLTQGFLATFVPFVVIVPYMIWKRRFTEFLKFAPVALLAGLVLALPWSLLIHQREPDFWRYFLWLEHTQRFASVQVKGAEHYWYFLPLVIGFPWLFLLFGQPLRALRETTSQQIRQLCGYCLCWGLIPLSLFFIAPGQLSMYVLHYLAPFAIVLGISSAYLIDAQDERLYLNGVQISRGILVVLLLVAVLNFTAGLGMPVWRAHETVHWIWCCGALLAWLGILRLALASPLEIRHWLIGLGVLPAFTLIPKYIPELIYAGRMPGVFIEEQAASISEDTLIATDSTLFSSVSWYLQRTDILLVGSTGDYEYGLGYPDAKARHFPFEDFNRFINTADRPVAYFEKFGGRPPNDLPPGASEGVMGRFILFRYYPPKSRGGTD